MPQKTSDPQAELERALAAGVEKYGPTSLHYASTSLPINRVPFVEPQINFATQGGMPFGRWAALYGHPMSGKSRVALELVAQAQQLPHSAEVTLIPRIAYHSALADDASLPDDVRRKHLETAENLDRELSWIRQEFPHGADAILYNAEAQFDPVWAKKLGVDNDRLMMFESVTIEEIMDVAMGLYKHVPIHIIDSTTNTSSIYRQKDDMGKPSYGRNALQWKDCLLHSLVEWDRERNIGIMIHQMSTVQNTGGSKSTATNYMNFISRLTLRFDHGAALYKQDGMLMPKKATGADEAAMAKKAQWDGREVFVTVEKSTVGRPRRIAGLQWDYARETFVTEHELALSGIYFRIIKKSGNWFSFDGESIAQGWKALYRHIAEDAELQAQVTCRLLDFVTQE